MGIWHTRILDLTFGHVVTLLVGIPISSLLFLLLVFLSWITRGLR